MEPFVEVNESPASERDWSALKQRNRSSHSMNSPAKSVSGIAIDSRVTPKLNEQAARADIFLAATRARQAVMQQSSPILVRPYRAFFAFGAACAAFSCFLTLLLIAEISLLPGAFLLIFSLGLGVSSAGMLFSARGR